MKSRGPIFTNHRRALLKSLGGFALLPFVPGVRAQPAPSRNVAVAVERGAPGLQIPPGSAGFSYEKSHLNRGYFHGANASLIVLFQQLGAGLLRIGGNSADLTDWTQNGPGGVAGQIAPADVDALAAFARATNWKILYCFNLAKNTPERLVSEAVYAANALGNSLYGFEIGNEPDLFSFAGHRPPGYAPAEFEKEWAAYAGSLKARLPDAVLTGPGTAGFIDSWTIPFASREKFGIRLLTHHYYRANGLVPSSTLALLLAGDPALPGKLEQLRAAADAKGIPYRMAEANSYYNSGAPNISNNFGTALWAIDFLFINAQHGSAGVNFHGGGATPGYTPIADSAGQVTEVRPGYYGMLLFSLAARGRLAATRIESPNSPASGWPFSAYAVIGDADTRVMLVNKDAAISANVTITLGASAASASLLRLSAPSLQSTSGMTLGGSPIRADGAWKPQTTETATVTNGMMTVNVPAASAVLVTAR